MLKKDVVYADIVVDSNINTAYRDYESCGKEYTSKEEVNYDKYSCLEKKVLFINKYDGEYFKVDFKKGYLSVFINYIKSFFSNKYILKDSPAFRGGIYINNIKNYYEDSEEDMTSLLSLAIDNVKKKEKSNKNIEL